MTEVETRPRVLGMMEARKRAGIGIERCSRFSGVSVRDVIRYERGRSVPGIRNAARIAAVLGVRVDEIEEFLPAVREVRAAGFVLADRVIAGTEQTRKRAAAQPTKPKATDPQKGWSI